MTYDDVRVLWSLIDRTDGRLELQSCLCLPGDDDAWAVWIGDRTRGITAYYRHLASFVAHYPSDLAAAPVDVEPPPLQGALTRGEIRRPMDTLDTQRDATYAWVVVHNPIGRYALVRNTMDESLDELVIATYHDLERVLGL